MHEHLLGAHGIHDASVDRVRNAYESLSQRVSIHVMVGAVVTVVLDWADQVLLVAFQASCFHSQSLIESQRWAVVLMLLDRPFQRIELRHMHGRTIVWDKGLLERLGLINRVWDHSMASF